MGLVEREKLEIERQFSPAIQVDVSPISHLLSEIDRRWEESLNLVEPTENGHLWFEHSQTVSLASVKKTIETLGVIGTSETFPPLCTATVIQPVLAHMANRILISSVDQQGKPCRIGGDQIEILLFAETENTGRLRLDSGELLLRIADLENGNYTAILPALQPGKYHLEIRILGRCIKNGRITFDLSPHIDCIRQWGCSLSQPVRVLAGADKDILILDTGNDRLVVFGDGIQRLRYIEGPAIWGKSTVGMTFSPQCQSIFTLNWRDKRITKWSYEGSTLCYSECESGSDPVDLCFDRRRDRVIVADNNASGHMIVYSGTDLALLNSVPLEIVNCRGPMGISCISAGLNEDVIVGGRNEVRIYTFEGKFLRFVDFWPYDRIQRPRNPVKTVRNSMSVAIVGGVVCDGDGLILTSVISCIDSQNKSSGCVASFISVSSYDGHLKFHIDSDTSRLKRPNGIGLRAVSDVGLCYVADLALNQIFTYRYK